MHLVTTSLSVGALTCHCTAQLVSKALCRLWTVDCQRQNFVNHV